MTTEFAGARWWKFDFHTHTPASADYGKGPRQEELRAVEPQEWLLQFMRVGIDCVAVTDHNSGEWIDCLNSKLGLLEEEGHEEFRKLVIFPGVEITTNNGVHILGLFAPGTSGVRIAQVLSDAGFRGRPGESDVAADKSVLEAAQAIRNKSGLPILAHVDRAAGAFDGMQGNALSPLLDAEIIAAIELFDLESRRPELLRQKGQHLPEILGSDAHHSSGGAGQRYPGSHFTWVKMETPTIEGLRLALLDGATLSLQRSDQDSGDPNERHGDLFIESIEINNAQFAGRGSPLVARFSPWMTALVGGRGSGKSTVIQFLRWVLTPRDDLPDSVRKDFEEFTKAHEPTQGQGALTPATRVTVLLRRGKSRLRVVRSLDSPMTTVEEEVNGAFVEAERGILTTLPVRILAQKEILELASAPEKLPSLLDRAPEIEFDDWRARWSELAAKFLRLRGEVRGIRIRLGDRDRLRGELHELRRKLNVFEEGGHREIFISFQRAQRQRRVIEEREKELGALEVYLRKVIETVTPSDTPTEEFEAKVETEAEALALDHQAREFESEIVGILEALAIRAGRFREDWYSRVTASLWAGHSDSAEQAYLRLIEILGAEGVEDPGAYGDLVRRHRKLDQTMTELDKIEAQLVPLEREAETTLEALQDLRRDLTRRRQAHLETTLRGNEYVSIDVLPYGADAEGEEQFFRKYIGKEGPTFKKDILEDGSGLLADLYRGLPPPDDDTRGQSIEERCRTVRDTLLTADPEAVNGSLTKLFRKHLQGLTDEQKDRIRMYWPRDSLCVKYRRTNRDEWVNVNAGGSKGQKSVAVLAFLLASGTEPIVLDQPEDDLDNHVIYDLVVRRLRELKPHRQIIVATHNPNIVVNGDAEMVLAMDFRAGQCVLVDGETGCLQDTGVRQGICRVMEGGKRAFRMRYERIGRVSEEENGG